MINFGQAVKKLRKSRKLTQLEVSKTLGVHVTDYARFEQGRVQVRLHKLDRILKAIDATDTEFLLMCIGKDMTEKERGMLYDILTEE